MKLPAYSFLIPASLMLGLAPFVPEPHLLEKVRWLLTGHPFRPIDVFDLFLHGTFPVLLLVKGGTDLMKKAGGASSPNGDSGEDAEGPVPPKSRAERRREEREKGKA